MDVKSFPATAARLEDVLFAFSVAPSGSGESVAAAVADAVAIVRESGLPNRTDSMFTTIEGEWDECLAVIKRACEAVGKHGNRVSLVLKADIRPGHTGEMTAKVDRLEAALTELHDREASRGTTQGTFQGQDGPVTGEAPVATD
jgi:uncharacterized protein (TIGR00106 family)